MMPTHAMGAPAAERCNDFGWHPRGEADPSLVAEIEERPRFGVGHAWSRSSGYSLTTAPERIYAVMPMEGAFEFTVEDAAVTVDAGSLILFDGATPTTARTLADTARFVWYLEPTFLQAGRSRFQYGESLPVGGSTAQALLAMTNALIANTSAAAPPAVNRHLAVAFENILAGVLNETSSSRRHHGEHRDGLFMAALASIGAHFTDPAFDVGRLAKDLAISPRTLYSTFERMGTTPRREIERRRVTEAERIAEHERLSVNDLATRSGFTSARQLARAFRRSTAEHDRSPDRSDA